MQISREEKRRCEMPGGDRTGPVGAGQKTVRGMGICAGSSSPKSFRPGLGNQL